ncbi:MAG: hypothetical protein IPN43_18905 [Chitinophagaceae bacterium]|nr:hypothetical protein [Chitinophagaceae bacterium]
MNTAIYIDQRIENLNSSIRIFRVISIILIIVGTISILFALLSPKFSFSTEIGKFGFGIINMLLPFYLQNESGKRKNKVSSLYLIKSQIETNPEIESFLIKKALEEI